MKKSQLGKYEIFDETSKECKVCVAILTYNQEKYIEKTINSVLTQNTNFDFKIIIAEDCSTDNTRNIVINFQKKFPKKIKLILQNENVGFALNNKSLRENIDSKYIATLEGDDYWTDENKLQKQFDFLENNPEFVIACHNFYMLDGDILKEESLYDHLNPPSEYGIVEMSKTNMVPTPTAMFRNIPIDVPNWWYTAPVGDYPLFLTLSKYGKIYYDNKKMAVYRENVGIWSGKKIDHKKMINFYENLSNDFSDNDEVKNNLLQQKSRHIKEYLKELPLKRIFSNEHFKRLTLLEKTKIIIRKLTKN